jgi:hypothetical protein
MINLTEEQKKQILEQYDKLGNSLDDEEFSKQECILLGFCVGANLPPEMFEVMLEVTREAQK